MSEKITIGDDYFAPCPSCSELIDIGNITRSNNLTPGYKSICPKCNKDFEIHKVQHIPVVYLKATNNETS